MAKELLSSNSRSPSDQHLKVQEGHNLCVVKIEKSPEIHQIKRFNHQSESESSYRQGEQEKVMNNRHIWTAQEEEKLLLLHNKMGNSWTEIGIHLNKDQNTVKNHFYAEIRKGIRKINSLIKMKYTSQTRALNLAQISKVITMLSEKNKAIPLIHGLEDKKQENADYLKREFIRYAKLPAGPLSEDQHLKLENLLNLITSTLHELKVAGLIGKKSSASKQATKTKLQSLNSPNKQASSINIKIEHSQPQRQSDSPQQNQSEVPLESINWSMLAHNNWLMNNYCFVPFKLMNMNGINEMSWGAQENRMCWWSYGKVTGMHGNQNH